MLSFSYKVVEYMCTVSNMYNELLVLIMFNFELN